MISLGALDLQFNRELFTCEAQVGGDHTQFSRMQLNFQAVDSARLWAGL